MLVFRESTTMANNFNNHLIEMNEIILNLPMELQEQCWQKAQKNSNSIAKCNAYYNNLCLQSFLPWLTAWLEEDEEHKLIKYPDKLAQIWEFINGTPIEVGETKLLLIPDVTMDLEEFIIPQEWVDIPDLIADYYLAVQINLDEDYLRVWGFTTHSLVKSKGEYDGSDRTYAVKAEDLLQDFSTLWLTISLDFKQEVNPLPELRKEETIRLMNQLSNPLLARPRLAAEFAKYGALITDEKQRQQLYNKRLGIVTLGQWLEGIIESGWQEVEEFLQGESTELAFRFNFRTPSAVEQKKIVTLEKGNEQINNALIVGLNQTNSEELDISVELYPTGFDIYLPDDLQLILLDEEGTSLMETKARNSDRLIFKLKGELGDAFSVKIALNDFTITEQFLI